ncbi:MAG TPA: nitrate/nitrite transporter NrtS [Dehalococcoidia bacterium]|nr:nitrate/nitrite transporter NrtS [Dehalococcoidia bacterium]
MTADVLNERACSRCRVRIAPQRGFIAGQRLMCLRCWLIRPALLRRSFLTALVVGSVITLINQGNVLLGGSFPPDLYWKIPLSYCVPFCVATWGALTSSRG